MSELIHETIVTTPGPDGGTHIVPLGIRHFGDEILLAPFRPSATLDNVLRSRYAVVNFSDDVRIFAGCLTGRRDWPLADCERVPCRRLADSLAHSELELARFEDDALRPRLYCRVLHSAPHRTFKGFNRAQAAVIEACILVSRLHMLPRDKVLREVEYLRIAIDKTAGPHEQEAWGWLMERIREAEAAGQEQRGEAKS